MFTAPECQATYLASFESARCRRDGESASVPRAKAQIPGSKGPYVGPTAPSTLPLKALNSITMILFSTH